MRFYLGSSANFWGKKEKQNPSESGGFAFSRGDFNFERSCAYRCLCGKPTHFTLFFYFSTETSFTAGRQPLGWWEGGEILGGRDGQAGGTWLASSRDGRLAFITNVRELQSIPQAKSRGQLPVRFLQSKKKPFEFAEEVVKEADHYNGFNLVLMDLCSKSMVYVTNRPKETDNFVTEVSPGIHVLSNASLDSPWLKAQRLDHNFKNVLARYSKDELPLKETVAELMMDTTKDDLSTLPRIYPPETEYGLSAIYIDVTRPQGRYGTRNQSALSVKSNGEVCFYERYLDKDLWKEQTVTYQIEMTK